jgi:hypothetical protein
VLAALLPQPRLEHLASDAAAPVRAAFADLLLAVDQWSNVRLDPGTAPQSAFA